MQDPYEIVEEHILGGVAGMDVGSAEYVRAMTALKTLHEAKEAKGKKGFKAWFKANSSELVKGGFVVVTAVLVGFIESKFDVIFRSKASKFF